MFETRVTIAGLTVAVTLPHEGWLPPLTPRIGKFLSESPHADASIAIRLDSDLARAPGGDPRVEDEADGLHLRHDNFDAWLSPEGNGQITIYQADEAPGDLTYGMVVDSVLRMAIAQLLADRGGIMFHAAGIAANAEAGYVFFGPSGSGKTTICGLSHPRYAILCDEIVAVKPQGDGYRLYGTPFAGAWGDSQNEDVPLKELFYLKQASGNRRVPLAPATALRALLESAVAYHRSPEFAGRLMDILLALMGKVPVTQLEFVAKESLWETVLSPTPTP